MLGGPAPAGLLARQGAIRLHQMEAWPLDAWLRDGARIRILSAGLRVLEEDRGDRLRPTADLLRWAGPRLAGRGLDLDDDEWRRMLDGAALRPPDARLPPSARRGDPRLVLLREGHPLAPARLKGGRVLHELPAPRAGWLRQVLTREAQRRNPEG